MENILMAIGLNDFKVKFHDCEGKICNANLCWHKHNGCKALHIFQSESPFEQIWQNWMFPINSMGKTCYSRCMYSTYIFKEINPKLGPFDAINLFSIFLPGKFVLCLLTNLVQNTERLFDSCQNGQMKMFFYLQIYSLFSAVNYNSFVGCAL